MAEGADPLLTLSGVLPVVVIERRNNFVACGIRAADAPLLLEHIRRHLPDVRLLVDGRPASPSIAALFRDARKATAIDLVARPGEAVWRFILYDPSVSGGYVSRRSDQAVGGVLYGEVLTRAEIDDLTQRMPELVRRVNSLPIDLVYAFVDSNDPEWRKTFAAARSRQGTGRGDAAAEGRFYSSDELRYSLRSVALHAPWAGTIHIVSNCRPPAWLDAGHARLRWVPHDQILDADCLPTFNSHAIEASLHRVPGVTEHFLYLNDDFFALDTLAPSDFVNENGTLNANLEPLGVVNSTLDEAAPDYLNAARNGADLLQLRYGYYPTRLHKHAPYSLKRSLLEQLEGEFADAVAMTRRAQFRSLADISVASFLAHHYGFARREVTYAGYPAELVSSSDPFFALGMRRLARAAPKPRIVCLNEGGTPSARWRRLLSRFMHEQFPIPAPWEREA
ncbi:MAG: stealth conserved region 3 domain-containing protein [Methyloceanibacter sp.]